VKQLVRAHAKGVAGGTSTGSAGVSQAPAAVAEPEAVEAEPAVEAEAGAPADDADTE
jgi:hypothetical protein